ncbi:MAG: hypothetical protein EAY75_02385 [Bacteroidetes bacterium]|nr:MAG: hypothetical protein EAY75_02385 [Bacteroidota bacterium]
MDSRMRTLAFAIVVLAGMGTLQAQKAGCTDPQATNFDSLATANNGSCVYTNTGYQPPQVGALGVQLAEVSGLVWVHGRLYGLNDGGNPNAIYRIDTTTGAIAQTIVLEGTTNIDWEDMAQDSSHIYVADVGNNGTGIRTNLVVYKFAKSWIAADTVTRVPAQAIERIAFAYADQTNFTNATVNNTRFDCEAVIVLRNQLHLFTKNWVSATTVHYTLPTQAGKHVAARKDSMATGGFMITGAAVAGYDKVVFTAYTRLGACALFLVFGFSDADTALLSGAHKRRLALPSSLVLGQLEAVAFENPLRGFLGAEAIGAFGVNQRLYRVSTETFVIDHYKRNAPQFAQPGMLRFNTTTDGYEWFGGAAWQRLHE